MGNVPRYNISYNIILSAKGGGRIQLLDIFMFRKYLSKNL